MSEPRTKEATRARLVDSSIQVLIDHGIDGATVDDLTSAAGFTRGAFYSNFDSKTELFLDAFALVTDRLIADLRTQVEASDPSEAAAAATLRAIDGLRANAIPWYLLQSEAISRAIRDPQFARHLTVQRRRLRTAIADVFRSLQAGGGVTLTLDPTLIAEAMLGVFLNLLLSEQLDGASDAATTAEVIAGMFHTFAVPR